MDDKEWKFTFGELMRLSEGEPGDTATLQAALKEALERWRETEKKRIEAENKPIRCALEKPKVTTYKGKLVIEIGIEGDIRKILDKFPGDAW